MPKYTFHLQAVSEDGEVATVRKGTVEAADRKTARMQILADYWDPRLDAASTWPSLVLTPAPETS